MKLILTLISYVKKSVSLFFLLCLSISCFAQMQRNYAQELVDLLQQDKYFEAREFKSRYASQSTQTDKTLSLLYDMHMSLAFNKPDVAIDSFKEFFTCQECTGAIGPHVAVYYSWLINIYEEKQEYDTAIVIAEGLKNYFVLNPYSLDSSFIEGELRWIEARIASLKEKEENEPRREIKRDSGVSEIKLKDDAFIRFEALYNGHKIETLLATWCPNYLHIDEDLAKEIGVKIKPNENPIQIVNGVEIRIHEGFIDAIEIGGVKLYNIPVGVYGDKFLSKLPNSKETQIIMGTAMMKLIGRFEFDWESNVLRIPERQESVEVNQAANLMLVNGRLYVNMKINEIEFTGFLNTGFDPSLSLTYPYFRNNRNHIKIESEKPESFERISTLGESSNLEREKIKDPEIYFDGKKFTNSDLRVYVADNIWVNVNVFDGEVGVEFIKNIGSKCILDLDMMTLQCKD